MDRCHSPTYAFPGPHKQELRTAVAEIGDRLATICQRYRETDRQDRTTVR